MDVALQNRGAKCTQLLHNIIEDLRNRTKQRSRQTDILISQLREKGIEILNSHLNRQTVVVWIWCQSHAALENVQKMYEWNQLTDVLFRFANIQLSTSEIFHSKVIRVDSNQLKKTVVVCPISINFTQRIDVGRYEIVWGVTKLRNKIYVLCRSLFPSSPNAICVFEDQSPFHLQKTFETREIKFPEDIGSSKKEYSLYISDTIRSYNENCIWKITRRTDDQHILVKWLIIRYKARALSVSSVGHLLMVSDSPSVLMIYGSDAKLLRSINLPRDFEDPRHAMETSIGNIVILHRWIEMERKTPSYRGETKWMAKEKKRESGSSSREWEKTMMWVVSELTTDGEMITRFIPSNEAQKLNDPKYLSIDTDDRVFVADYGNDRVILLDSNLKWNRILCPTKEETEETKIQLPQRLCYDEENKQLIVAGYFYLRQGVNIYTLSL